MAMTAAGAGGGGGRHRRRRAPVMAEINVTPMVDVMLVLLDHFMVAAPLLTTNIQVDLPTAQGGTLTNAESVPLTVSVKKTGGSWAQGRRLSRRYRNQSRRAWSEDEGVKARDRYAADNNVGLHPRRP